MEIWKNIDGYNGLYQISNLGRVKSCERYRKGKNNIPTKVNERLLKQTLNNGYLSVGLSKEGKIKYYYIHRLVASAFIDNPDNYNEVNHIN